MNPTKLNTVRVMKNGMLRVGCGLLGKKAGQKDLRFLITFVDGSDKLKLTPSLKPPGWKVTYYADNAQSPCVSLSPFMRLYGLPDNYFPCGEFNAEKNDSGSLFIDFNSRVNTLPKKKGGKK